MVIAIPDWKMGEKPAFRNCFGPASNHVAGMFEDMQREKWNECLKGVNPLSLNPMTWTRRVELGREAEQKLASYMAEFKASCGTCDFCEWSMRALNARTGIGGSAGTSTLKECEIVTKERVAFRKAHCILKKHGQKGVPSAIAEHMLHCTLHALFHCACPSGSDLQRESRLHRCREGRPDYAAVGGDVDCTQA